MQRHQLKRTHKNPKSQVVGRGGKRGKTSGRGTKGQKARSGHKMRPEIRELIKKLPKLRGRGKHSLKSIQALHKVLNLEVLDKAYKDGEAVNPETLKEKSLVSGKIAVKILGGGEISKALTISGCAVSVSAKEKIEKAGGKII